MTDKTTLEFETLDGVTVKLSIHQLARMLDYKQLAYLLDNVLNGSGMSYGIANNISAEIVRSHRTIQASFVRFCLWCLKYYYHNYQNTWADHTDARNEVAVKAAKIVSDLMDDGTIPNPPLI